MTAAMTTRKGRIRTDSGENAVIPVRFFPGACRFSKQDQSIIEGASLMPALTATRPTTGIQSAEDLVWMRPARGFDAWVVRRDLEAADQVLDDWDRQSSICQEPPTALPHALPADNSSPPTRDWEHCVATLRTVMARALSVLGFATLPVGAGLALGSFSGDHHHLWDWGLATLVVGQMVLLLASLVDRKH
jgi:hypothetical protein